MKILYVFFIKLTIGSNGPT